MSKQKKRLTPAESLKRLENYNKSTKFLLDRAIEMNPQSGLECAKDIYLLLNNLLRSTDGWLQWMKINPYVVIGEFTNEHLLESFTKIRTITVEMLKLDMMITQKYGIDIYTPVKENKDNPDYRV